MAAHLSGLTPRSMLVDLLLNPLATLLSGRRPERPDLQRPWRVWDLDSELRYLPVVQALPVLAAADLRGGQRPAGARRLDGP